MNILHQVNNLEIGGVETFVYRLCKYSNENWVGVFSHQDGLVREWLENIGIEVYIQGAVTIEDVIKEREVDVLVLHTGSTYPEYVYGLKEKFPNLKIVACMHTVWAGDPSVVDKIVCVSSAIYNVQMDFKKSRVIYPGVDRKDRFVIGEVTRIAPYKYIEDLIKLCEILAPDYPEILFKIIGTDAEDAIGYTEQLKAIIKEKGLENSFEFPGFVPYIDYDKFDMFIHLVGDEAYPVTLLEALDRNIPTITYDKRGTKEIHAQYPKLITVNDLDEAKIIIRLLIGGRPKHIKECTNEFTEVYKEVMKN